MYTCVVFAVSPTSWWSCWLWLCWITEWWCHLLHELCDTTTLHDTRHTWGSSQCGWGKYRGGKVCRYSKKPADLDLHCQSIQIFNIAGQQGHVGAMPHCVSFSMWIYINNLDQVIWLADNLKRPRHLNLFSMARVNMCFFFFFLVFIFIHLESNENEDSHLSQNKKNMQLFLLYLVHMKYAMAFYSFHHVIHMPGFLFVHLFLC